MKPNNRQMRYLRMMLRTFNLLSIASFFGILCGIHPSAAAELYSLEKGDVQLQSAGSLAFGPSGILFVGDAKAAKVYALNTEDEISSKNRSYDIANLSEKLAAALKLNDPAINDLAVNPVTGNAFVSVTSGSQVSIARIATDGSVGQLDLKNIAHSSATLPNAPEDKEVGQGRRRGNPRNNSITDLAYTAGRVLVAGLAAGESPSSVHEFTFPFNESSAGASVEIFHAAHGRSEDYAPIQTFVPFNIGDEPSLLAGYICTPLVKIPVNQLKSKNRVTGTTVAELGNRNRPLDMLVYQQHGKAFLLMSNSARGVMKISTEDLENNAGLTERVANGGVAGQPYETIESLKGVVQLAKLDEGHALVIQQEEGAPDSLVSIELP